MRYFTGQYERTIDVKKRIQIPSQLRSGIDPQRDGTGLYVVLGEYRGTLSVYTERGFNELAGRISTESMAGPESRLFELQFYSLASHVEFDKQGRLVLPDKLVRKARLQDEVSLVGQKTRFDIWNREAFERTRGIDWDGDDWPDWSSFIRMPSTLARNEGQ